MGKLVKCKTCGEEIAKNAKFCPKCGAKRKKHTVLGILLVIIGVFLFVGAFGAANSPDEGNPKSPQDQEETQTRDDSTQPDSTEEDDSGNPEQPEEPKNKPTISMSEFESISSGMTYEEVVEIIGSEGELLSESDLGIGDAYKSAIYMWEGEGSLGANANVTFQGGKVLSKAQMGLE